VLDNPELASWIKQVDQRTPVWAAGRVAERVRQGLVKSTNGALTAGPVAFVATLDPTDGAAIDLGVIMADSKDANTLETFAKEQLKLFAMAAQVKNLGSLVDQVSIEASDQVVRFKAKLAINDINRLFCLLDGSSKCGQDATP